jgi:hypothetical protein
MDRDVQIYLSFGTIPHFSPLYARPRSSFLYPNIPNNTDLASLS